MTPTKIVILGANGQVGYELQRSLLPLGEVIALDRTQADLTQLDNLKQTLIDLKPNVIVNAAAYTAVDKAEEEQDLAMLINGEALKVIAEATKQLNALLIHYSTDYVFDGTKTEPYTEDDTPNPINVYGKTKLAGENAVIGSGCDYLLFRTSWVYSLHGHNFLKTILRFAQEREELSIVDDQIGRPTWARSIADVTVKCISQALDRIKENHFTSDLYHLSSQGDTSWYGFALEIIEQTRQKMLYNLRLKKLAPISTDQYPTLAKRPANSRLCADKLENDYNVLLPNWQHALTACISEYRD